MASGIWFYHNGQDQRGPYDDTSLVVEAGLHFGKAGETAVRPFYVWRSPWPKWRTCINQAQVENLVDRSNTSSSFKAPPVVGSQVKAFGAGSPTAGKTSAQVEMAKLQSMMPNLDAHKTKRIKGFSAFKWIMILVVVLAIGFLAVELPKQIGVLKQLAPAEQNTAPAAP